MNRKSGGSQRGGAAKQTSVKSFFQRPPVKAAASSPAPSSAPPSLTRDQPTNNRHQTLPATRTGSLNLDDRTRPEGKMLISGKVSLRQPSSSQAPAWWSSGSFSGSNKAAKGDLIVESAPVLGAKRKSDISLSQDLKRRSFNARSATKSGSNAGNAVGGALSRTHANQVKEKAVALSDQQKDVIDAVFTGSNVFFTGAAGTGKSFLLHYIIKKLRAKYRYDEIAVAATTGLAALNIGGTTIHRWAGIGLGIDSVENLARKIERQAESRRRWLNTKVLIIDEVSMLDAALFEKLEALARRVCRQNKPFGGIQLILTGDFFQLPPVVKTGADPRLCFEAKCWSETMHCTMLLAKVFRQKEDDKLATMLNALREGNLTAEIIASFRQLSRPLKFTDGIAPTELYPRREQVDRANKEKMLELKTRSFIFQSEDVVPDNRYDASKLLENVMAPKMIELKVGAQVLLIQNKSTELVNGSRGTILTFATEVGHQELMLMNNLSGGLVYKYYNQMLDLNGVMTDELSREMNDKLSEEQRSVLLRVFADGPKYPVVDFGNAGQSVIEPAEFIVSGPAPKYETVAKRTQIPLILSYALSIHKAQGQTIPRLVVDLNKVFEKGQVYVAISRATCYDQLQVIGFDERRVSVDQRVVEFYKTLTRLDKERNYLEQTKS